MNYNDDDLIDFIKISVFIMDKNIKFIKDIKEYIVGFERPYIFVTFIYNIEDKYYQGTTMVDISDFNDFLFTKRIDKINKLRQKIHELY